ncbi:hypothetical protein ABK046_46465, partial [Streptomyces caeruleatus]
IQPLIYFIGYCFISGLLGIDPYRSGVGILRLSFFSLFIVAVADISRKNTVLIPIKALMLGSTIAALYVVIKTLSAYFLPDFVFPKLFIGT